MPSSKKRPKRETASSKKNMPSDVPSQEECSLSKAEQLTVNQLIAQTLIRYKNEQLQDKKQKFREVGHLAGICEEYLSSFALIGYTLEGEKVVVFNHATPKDQAALMDLLRTTFIGLMSNEQ